MPAGARRHWLLLACGAGIGLYPLGLLAGLGESIPRHLGLFYAASLLYLLAVVLGHRSTVGGPSLAAVVAVALGLRLLMLLTQPALSDDLYRYIWDGKVLLHGVNPYGYPPGAEELARLRDDFWRPINAKGQVTPYPPGAEAVFGVTYALAGSRVHAQQLAATLGDLLVIAILWQLVRGQARRQWLLLVYAWSPLALMEYAHSAHNDAWMVAALLGAVWLASRGRQSGSAVALALSVLLKLFGGVALPALAARWGARQLVLFSAVVLGAFAPFFIGANPLKDILFEAGGSRFNDSLYFPLDAVAVRIALPPLATITAAAALAGLAAQVFRYVRGGGEAALGAFALLVGLLLLSPVVEPWYALWALPFVPLAIARGGPGRAAGIGWLAFSVLVPLTELSYVYGPHVWPFVRLVEYLPLYGMLGVAANLAMQRTQPRDSGAVQKT